MFAVAETRPAAEAPESILLIRSSLSSRPCMQRISEGQDVSATQGSESILAVRTTDRERGR
jgi:hypothetical protein